jgi:dihydroorotate dehydrogenase
MIYQLIRTILFQLEPEKAHELALNGLQCLARTRWSPFTKKSQPAPFTLMGLTFKNRVGLAAGLDKNGDYIDALGALGFGHLEIGTITPLPQAGNPPPRLFRLVEDEAIINRMGFNSKGADYVLKQLEKKNYQGILGINIGKNKVTPIEKALDDYLVGFRTFAAHADYITINISSPNTEKLRDLQQAENLTILLTELKKAQTAYQEKTGKYVPLVVKIAPDLVEIELREMAAIFLQCAIDGIIATNTTIVRARSLTSAYAKETGGLSGRPLFSLSTQTLSLLNNTLQNRIPLIGVGGIMDKASAEDKIKAGASLLQIYSGFIYKGPALIRECC